MSDFEDRIRRAMRRHEGAAPTSANTPLNGWRSARPGWTWRPQIAVAAAIVLIAALTYGIGSRDNATPPPASPPSVSTAPSNTTAPGAPSCPADYAGSTPWWDVNELWVPSTPEGVDGADQLVPPGTPTHVVICKYNSDHNHPDEAYPLAGTKELRGNLAAVSDELSWAPRAYPGQTLSCPAVARANSGLYLVGLSYPQGQIWVNPAWSECGRSTNGIFQSMAWFNDRVAAWYDTGAWTAPTAPSQRCPIEQAGRWGQAKKMVPDTPTGLTICDAAHPSGVTITTDLTALIAAVNAPPTELWKQGYHCTKDQLSPYYLAFTYADGPPVLVTLTPDCDPDMFNYSLQAKDTGAALAIVQSMVADK